MDIEEDLKILQEFTELDRKLRNYKVKSDYDNFCERRCVAIDHILAEIEKDKNELEEWQKAYQEEKDKQFDILRNSILKQKVKDNFNKLNTRIKDFKNPEIKKYFSIEQIIYLLEQFENKLLEDK